MKKKTLLMLLSTVLVIAAAAAGTIAYLTDTSAVTNTFAVGKVDIVVQEALVNADGQPIDETGTLIGENDPPVMKEAGNAYHLMPGQTYTKNPTLTVKAGSEEAYVRMMVTVTDMANVEAAFGADYIDAAQGYFLLEKLVTGWDQNVWPCVSITPGTEDVKDANGNTVAVETATYEFRYHQTAKGETAAGTGDNALPALFTTFTIPGAVDGEALAKLAQMEIRIVGNAIQAVGFDNADDAWAAFNGQMASSNTNHGAGSGDNTNNGATGGDNGNGGTVPMG